MNTDEPWYRACHASELPNGGRIHIEVNGRYVTIFRNKGELSCIDARTSEKVYICFLFYICSLTIVSVSAVACYHAGGPLTKGELQDIEDLGNITVVLCPWHKFMVDIKTGIRAYQAIEVIDGKPTPTGWKHGKHVHRAHEVVERTEGGTKYVYVLLNDDPELECPSDSDAVKEACMNGFKMHSPAVGPCPMSI
jgi:nitrite reductase/ring-hydroxylating ferredoxin subunit